MSWHWYRPDLMAQFTSQSAHGMPAIYIYDGHKSSSKVLRNSKVSKNWEA